MKQLILFLSCFLCLCLPVRAANLTLSDLNDAITKASVTKEERLEARIKELEVQLSKPQVTYRTEIRTRTVPYTYYQRVKICHGTWCEYVNQPVTGYRTETYQVKVPIASSQHVISPEAAPTPMNQVKYILSVLKPTRNEVLVDFGCGADARFLVEAVKTYGCTCIGFEIDAERAKAAECAVKAAGYDGYIRIVHGDSTKYTDYIVKYADVGVAYLYPGTLKKLKPVIRKLKRFASYMHKVDGVTNYRYGDFYVSWKSVQPTVQYTVPVKRYAVWDGQLYSGPLCNNPYCSMCNSIRKQLGL